MALKNDLGVGGRQIEYFMQNWTLLATLRSVRPVGLHSNNMETINSSSTILKGDTDSCF